MGCLVYISRVLTRQRCIQRSFPRRELRLQPIQSRSYLVFVRTMATGPVSTSGSSGVHKGGMNRLGSEKSPYLLQHATNPVDWYPWGDEAIAKAKQEDKPIFLSVGYSTCHWCHVMERESFENEEIAKLMNENFVNIKVDREERPDIDRVYMTYIQATSGGGGWPMSVWLTPDLKPILGGTYFPPDDRYFGRPGFQTLLRSICEQWNKNKEKLIEQGTRITEILREASKLKVGDEGGSGTPNTQCLTTCFKQLACSYDKDLGGFGKAPKFPQPANLLFLFRMYAQDPQSEDGKEALSMCLHTLKMMAKGGIHDHIAQGFHRYSTDNDWHVPHFEKMLYDQAQLAVAYLEAFQITQDVIFADVAKDILTYVSRDLSHESGGFYSAEDADSLPTHSSAHKREGAFCVWEEKEIQDLLTEPLKGNPEKTIADVVCYHYDVQPSGNVDPYQDPHEELKDKNILILRGSEEKTAKHFNLSVDDLKSILKKANGVLFEARRKRPQPHLDDKIITGWNGLMISGFAHAARILGEDVYAERALKAASFLRKHLYNESAKKLLRSAYKSEDNTIVQIDKPIPAVLEDYVFTIQGLLDVYDACFDSSCLLWAEELQKLQDDCFWDDEHGGYYISGSGDPSVLIRLKDDQDGAEPSANSISVSNLLRLSVMLNRPDLKEKASQLLCVYSDRLNMLPLALPAMICGLMRLKAEPRQFIIAGAKDDSSTKELLHCINKHFLPFTSVFLLDQSPSNILTERFDSFKNYTCIDGKPAAYICENFSCFQPVTSVPELQELLLKIK